MLNIICCSLYGVLFGFLDPDINCENVQNSQWQPVGRCYLLCFPDFVKASLLKISSNFSLLVSVFRGETGEVGSGDSKMLSQEKML